MSESHTKPEKIFSESQKATLAKIEANVKRTGKKVTVSESVYNMSVKEIGQEWCSEWLQIDTDTEGREKILYQHEQKTV
jgi:hypothetical protein